MLLGQMAALGAAVAFSFTSTMFTLAGRKYGALVLMRSSLPIGLIGMVLLHWTTVGEPFPHDVGTRWVWLGTSGIIGFWLGSISLVNAFVLIGPRLSLLVGASAPILSSILAWLFFNEGLESQAVVGIVLTLGGITWVVSEHGQDPSQLTPERHKWGILFALGGALGQATSVLLAKQGLQGDFDPLSGSLIRLIVATMAIWLFTIVRGQAQLTLQKLREYPREFQQMSVGAIAGPVIGASLSLVAVANAPVGVATTLLNLTPIFLIPISYVVFKERITRRAVVGTIIAIMGTAVLFVS